MSTLVQPSPQADEFKTQKSPLPKLQMKGGDATVVTRTINEWVQKTALALNTWSSSAVQYWHQAVTSARAAHQQWTMLTQLNRSCFAPTDVSGGSDHEGRALQLTFTREGSISCYPEECCHSVRPALPDVTIVLAFGTSNKGGWSDFNRECAQNQQEPLLRHFSFCEHGVSNF